jgi:hypothetical protein
MKIRIHKLGEAFSLLPAQNHLIYFRANFRISSCLLSLMISNTTSPGTAIIISMNGIASRNIGTDICTDSYDSEAIANV